MHLISTHLTTITIQVLISLVFSSSKTKMNLHHNKVAISFD